MWRQIENTPEFLAALTTACNGEAFAASATEYAPSATFSACTN